MDYEKKYKEIVGKIRKAYLYAITDSTKTVLEEIFPELRDSNDEKIRKEIVRFIQMEVEDEIVGNKWLAWLEKQGEQILANSAKTCKNEQKPIISGDALREGIVHFGITTITQESPRTLVVGVCQSIPDR